MNHLPPQAKVVQVGDSFADGKEFLGEGKFFPAAGSDLPLHAACNFIGRQPRIFGYDTERFGNAALMVFPKGFYAFFYGCLLYTSPSPRDTERSRMPSSA